MACEIVFKTTKWNSQAHTKQRFFKSCQRALDILAAKSITIW